MTAYKALYEEAKKVIAQDTLRMEDMQSTIDRLSDSLTAETQAFAAHRSQTQAMVDLTIRNETRQYIVENNRLQAELAKVYELLGRLYFEGNKP